MKPTITVVIITKNEEEMIANCLETVQWCDEILVIDTGSDDRTISIAKQHNATVISIKKTSFADFRNEALEHVKTDWVFYLDADERVMPKLYQEIMVHIETAQANALSFIRLNMMYGKYFEHGGWENERVTRVFRLQEFKGWQGDIHESPVFDGASTLLHTPLLHLTHRGVIQGLHKTISWTPIEARLLYEAKTPLVTLKTLLRKGLMEFLRRGVFKKGYKDGMAGWVEAVVQGINRILVYIQLWELQQTPPLLEKYQEQEREIAQLWKKVS